MIKFKSKIKLLNYIKYNLNHTFSVGDKIQKGDFYDILVMLVNNHYNSNNLIGVGIDYFFISNSAVYSKNREFWIMRTDGTSTNFSYIKAANGKIKSDESYLKRAFRQVIQKYTDDFKVEYFKNNADKRGYVVCEVTGIKISIKTCHIDHIYPNTFDSLYYEFLKSNNLSVGDIKYEIKEGFDIPFICDKRISDLFYDFHSKNARLRCIYWRANVQGKRTKYIK